MMESIGEYSVTDFIGDHRLMLLSDGNLRTDDGQIFHIHKSMLARSSKYFYALFCDTERDKSDILISGVKGEVLSSILSYIYTGNLEMTEESMSELVVASDYLMLDDLLSHIRMRLRNSLSIVNCLSVFTAALEINRDDILLETYRFVQTHFESVVNRNGKEFAELPLEALKLFLSDRNLCVRNERTVYLSIIRWIEADSLNRLHWMPDLLMYLVIFDVDEELATEIVQHETVAKNAFCKEIMDIKLSFSNASNLQIVQTYFEHRTKPVIYFYTHRLPEKLNCIAHHRFHDETGRIEIYLTYDGKIDLWRKILEIDFTPHQFLICIKNRIYTLRTNEFRNFYYDIVEKQWHEISGSAFTRFKYVAVQLEECIYILGGYSTAGEVYDVEVYDTAFNIWYHTTPIIPITSFCATTLNKSIYVVGTFRYSEMIAQVYHAPSETWNLLPLPPVLITRSQFALVSYLDKIYVIGGMNRGEHLKAVQTYDPVTGRWTRECDLPHSYHFPSAKVFRDLLVVYDNRDGDVNVLFEKKHLKTNPPVFWNVSQSCWERFDESPPIDDLQSYQFLTIEDHESISVLSKENRDPDAVFEKSPFNETN